MIVEKYSAKERQDILRRDLKEYESTIEDLTEEERKNLREWLKSGESPFDNPYIMHKDRGEVMDYITAIRITEEMRRNPTDYGIGVELVEQDKYF